MTKTDDDTETDVLDQLADELDRAQPSDAFYTVSEVAALLKVTPRTVRGWVQDGRLEGISLGPRAIRIPAAEVRRVATHGLEDS